ncbi:MAG: sigma-54 dependent transcriptional regulator [Nitrospira sp.]|nr:sigma-54 dependent transcriptional regulator [Nitrospira sp.]
MRRLGPAGELVGESAPMKKLREKIARAAPTSATVLIVGETGTGKELAARAVHNLSPRKSQPFVAVNCAALQESLLESELFGHAKGAFTGATSDRKGLFEAAHGGTLFLDEAGEMPLSLQAKLLRVLTDSKVTPVGSTRSREVDVRLVLATHRDLEQRVKDGQFREDLYYRVHVLPLEVPPLRDRPEDVPALVDVFLREVAVEFALPVKTIEPSALDVLKRYPFPGNVRELKNAIERAYILSAGEAISAGDLQLAQREQPASGDVGRLSTIAANLPQRIDLRSLLVELERELLVRALRRADGVQAEAARALGITRSDISYKIRKHGLG